MLDLGEAKDVIREVVRIIIKPQQRHGLEKVLKDVVQGLSFRPIHGVW